MDGTNDVAVIGVPVDYSKAYNRMKHSDILCNLVALNVPTCAVKLIQSYLTKRSMCIKYKGAVSSFKSCPGGGPQGGLLTGILFCLQVNKAGAPCPLPQTPSLGQEPLQTPPEDPAPCTFQSLENSQNSQLPSSGQEPAPCPPSDQAEHPLLRKNLVQGPLNHPREYQDSEIPLCHQKQNLHKKAYIDDLTLLEKISLAKLIEKERIIGPLDWHDRFNLTMPPSKSILQHQLFDLSNYTKNHFMVLNKKKTKCIPFVNSKTKDYMPQLSLEEGEYLEVIYQLKLVGLVITSDLSWNEHTQYTVSRVNNTIW
jgi:hypothetical protein